MDTLAALLAHFSLRAGVFYSGTLCGVQQFRDDGAQGHIHLIKRGPVHLSGVRRRPLTIMEPSLLFLPHARTHKLIADKSSGADLVCGTIQFGHGRGNPIVDSLPPVICVGLASMPGVESLLALIFDEGFSQEPGRQAVLDRLCEILIVRLLRYCLERGLTENGALAGLADPRLSKALAAIHDDPARDWNLPAMAELAGMSRARFAARFRDVVGETPADYLASWRVAMSQRLIKDGVPVKEAALDVGYGSASAFTRAFTRIVGTSPANWAKREFGNFKETATRKASTR